MKKTLLCIITLIFICLNSSCANTIDISDEILISYKPTTPTNIQSNLYTSKPKYEVETKGTLFCFYYKACKNKTYNRLGY